MMSNQSLMVFALAFGLLFNVGGELHGTRRWLYAAGVGAFGFIIGIRDGDANEALNLAIVLAGGQLIGSWFWASFWTKVRKVFDLPPALPGTDQDPGEP